MANKDTKEKKKKSESRKKKAAKALKIANEIASYIDKTFINKEVTAPAPMKSTELKPFRG